MGMTDIVKSDGDRLIELEMLIQEDLKAIFRIGMTLMVIRDEKLWKGNYKSFEDYCNERWQKGSNWARKMIRAVEVKEVVPVENEWQARQLSDLPDEDKVAVFEKAVDEVGDPARVTGAQLKRIKSTIASEAIAEEAEDDGEVWEEKKAGFRHLVEDMQSCVSALNRVSTAIVAIGEQDDGAWLDMDEFKIDMKNIKANIKMATPHDFCPYCKGTGVGEDGNPCPACRGLGWVPKSVWESAPDASKEALRESMEPIATGSLHYDSETYDPDIAAVHDPRDDEDLDPGNEVGQFYEPDF